MKPLASGLGCAVILLSAATLLSRTTLSFDERLSKDKQATHVLNRMTFGPRPGDVEQVRRMGVEKWIAQQLHPEQIQENPVLEAKLQPLNSLQLATWQIFEKYPQTLIAIPGPPPLQTLLTPEELRKVTSGNQEERRAVLASLPADKRQSVLAVLPPQALDGLRELQDEATKARANEAEARRKEMQRLMPPLVSLLGPDQIRTTQNGSPEEKRALINSLPADKRQMVMRVLQPQVLNNVPELRREAVLARQPQEAVNAELIENKLYRAIYSHRQLEEVLVDFWLNHFNVFNGKAQVRVLLTSYERDAIRPHVFGRFEDMLLATARHPAMLVYLDNVQSRVLPDDLLVPAAVRRPSLNENYARELMELHTMGVDGGYTQADVVAVARAFTGWTVFNPARYGEFQFDPAGHDRKEKTILGHKFPAGGGEQEGVRVIDILARHPSTATFISRRLAQRFVANNPPQSLVRRMADTFTKTDGNLRAVMEVMFASREFLSEGAWRAKLKSPLEMAVSAVRVLDAEITDTFSLSQRLADLGQPIYGKVEPTGYPNTDEIWMNSAGLWGRMQFAAALAEGQLPGIKVNTARLNGKSVRDVAEDLLDKALTPETLAALEKGLRTTQPAELITAILSSPEFQRR